MYRNLIAHTQSVSYSQRRKHTYTTHTYVFRKCVSRVTHSECLFSVCGDMNQLLWRGHLYRMLFCKSSGTLCKKRVSLCATECHVAHLPHFTQCVSRVRGPSVNKTATAASLRVCARRGIWLRNHERVCLSCNTACKLGWVWVFSCMTICLCFIVWVRVCVCVWIYVHAKKKPSPLTGKGNAHTGLTKQDLWLNDIRRGPQCSLVWPRTGPFAGKSECEWHVRQPITVFYMMYHGGAYISFVLQFLFWWMNRNVP